METKYLLDDLYYLHAWLTGNKHIFVIGKKKQNNKNLELNAETLSSSNFSMQLLQVLQVSFRPVL